MNNFDAVVFDYDGTLFDTRRAIIHCLRRAFEQCRRPTPLAETTMAAVKSGLPLQETLISIDPTMRMDPVALSEIVHVYRRLYLDEGTPLLHPFAGAAEALQELHRGGTKCVVVSNKGTAAVRRSLDNSGFSAFVDAIFGDAPGLPKKPDPAVLTEHILPRFERLEARRVLIIGDTEIDILFARRCGSYACWASYGYGDVDRCRSLEPDYEIASMDALSTLIRAQNALNGSTIAG
jgi:phosphoglycolate phosphatase